MPIIASDDFNRANESPLASPWTTGTGNLSSDLVSNAMSIAVPTDDNRANIYTGPVWPDDQWSKAALTVSGTVGGRAGPALYVRYSSSSTTFYRFSTDHAGATNCNISRFLAGARTTIVDFTQAWTDRDIWEFRVEGPAGSARLRTFLNGVQISDTTDNSSLSSGTPGAGVSGSALETWSVDNWSGGTGDDTRSSDDPPIGILGRGAGW